MSIFSRLFVLSFAALAFVGTAVATQGAPASAPTAAEITPESLYWG